MKVIIPDIKIAAIAAYLPQERIEFSTFSSVFGASKVAEITKVTGVERVRYVSEGETSSDMCYHAATHLLAMENLDKNGIDGLIFVSQTPDYRLPATSVVLQNRLGLSKDVACLDIPYGCSGYIYGVCQAAFWVHSGMCRNVLLLVGDACSKLISPYDKSLKLLFGDCGTATLMSKGNSPLAISLHSDGSGYDKLIIPAGAFRHPISLATNRQVMDEDGNSRSQEDMYMDGMEIFSFAVSKVPKNILETISLVDWTKEDVSLFALHQANRFIIDCIRKQLKVGAEKFPVNLTDYGNTGPASIPLLLSDILGGTLHKNLTKVIMSGFGVGLSWGSIACDLSDTHFYKPLNL